MRLGIAFLLACVISVSCAAIKKAKSIDDLEVTRRREIIKKNFLHAWRGYRDYAGFEHDELRPVTNKHYDWMYLSLTLVSALDTLYIMDFQEEFREARHFIQTDDFSFDKDLNVSLFETTIRIVGGLLSAWELSSDTVFLLKAKDLADRLLFAFNQSTIGIPYPSINLKTHVGAPTWGSHVTTLAEIGSLQLEFNYLSKQLNDPIYAQKVNFISYHLDDLNPPAGLYPLMYDLQSGNITGLYGYTLTTGASADSFYEYLLKQWIQSNKTDEDLRIQYDEAVDGIVRHLLRRTESKRFYLVQYVNNGFTDLMDHLSCFLPGMLALGAHGSTASRDMRIAEELMVTCVDMYACSASGLAAESVRFKNGTDFEIEDPKYLLRPETVESLFILWRLTKKDIYREWGWMIFESLVKSCKTKTGFSGLRDVRWQHPEKDDIMQGYFLSETLKYLFLLFSEDNVLPLHEYVFNTEAHPMFIFKH